MKTKLIPSAERSYHHGNLFSTLLDAAEEELIERGMEGFSLRGVAKRAEVSHAHEDSSDSFSGSVIFVSGQRLAREHSSKHRE